jgi:hypothetical protein
LVAIVFFIVVEASEHQAERQDHQGTKKGEMARH